MKRLVILLGAFLLVANVAVSQTLPNPTGAEWTCSADHSSISSYEIGWFLAGATAPVSTTDLGKPIPTAANLCTSAINVMPLAFAEYSAKVRCKVAGAPVIYSEWSDPSNLFQRVPGKPGGVVVKK